MLTGGILVLLFHTNVIKTPASLRFNDDSEVAYFLGPPCML